MAWLTGRPRRSRRELAASALVLAGLGAFVLLVYTLVVVGGGALLGRGASPSLPLSVIATAVVALAFDPVQTRLEDAGARLVHGGQPQPYDVLRRFASTVSGSYPAEELPARMARVLTEGTGAAWSQVWLVVGGRSTLASAWPPGAGGSSTADAPGRRSREVRHGGETLGVLVVQERAEAPLTGVEERLFAGLADQAGLLLRSIRLRSELERRLAELSTRAEELRASRGRLVDVQDERRRTLERDIHDGAQQHLVALAVNLRLAQGLLTRSPDRALRLLADQEQAAADAIDTIVRLARGIYPPLLVEQGVAAALRASAATSPVPVEVTSRDNVRYPAPVAAAAYFCSLEALQNAAKHAGASRIRIDLRGEPDALSVTIEDDGSGFDPRTAPDGAGLTNLRDRVESVGGTVRVESAPGRGTRVLARLPARTSTDAGKGA